MSAITVKNIKDFTCRYHRNGVAGEGFDLCQFTFISGWQKTRLQAVVFEAPGRVAITNPKDIFDRYMGNVFEPLIRRMIEEVPDDMRFQGKRLAPTSHPTPNAEPAKV